MPAGNQDSVVKRAKNLYFAGYRLIRIAEILKIPPTTLATWKRREAWDKVGARERVESSIEQRLVLLIQKNEKEGRDFKEIDLLTRQLDRLSRLESSSKNSINATDSAERTPKNKKNGKQNYISEENADKIRKVFYAELFEFQLNWANNRDKRIRNILKSHQIGATYYFAREALVDAIERLHPKIFISASKSQAHQFREYIIQLAQTAAGIELRGDPLVIRTDNGEVTLRFLGTNSKTAQSYHGDLYIDEYFWINKFMELRKVASGMAAHKQWTTTYFSTPSAITHEAYDFWTGKSFNKGRKKTDSIELDVSEKALHAGKMCADGQWRHIVTLESALSQGCNLFDIKQIKLEYSPDEYGQLFDCKFVDDSANDVSIQPK